jgi:hypothetical protein
MAKTLLPWCLQIPCRKKMKLLQKRSRQAEHDPRRASMYRQIDWPDRRHLVALTDKKKQARYPEAVKSYKRFLGKKEIHWFNPPRAMWKYGGLTVRVNPELGLQIKGKKYAIKLYFKGEKPTKDVSVRLPPYRHTS